VCSPVSLIALCGKNRIAVSALSYTLHALSAWELDIPVVACPNRDDTGEDTWQPSLVRAAALAGIEAKSIPALEGEPGLLLLSLEFDRIIKTGRFASKRLYNVHFSRLPKYRGVYTSLWPILNGETEAGVTLHEIRDQVDAGPIIDQRVFPLRPYTTARQLYELYTDEALLLFRDNLSNLIQGNCRLTDQEASEATYYSRTSLNFESLEIDLFKDAGQISRFVRGFYFPEYQVPKLRGRGVQACNVIECRSSLPAGTTVRQTLSSSSFVAGDGKIVELVWV
jgi:methionyl-tRNA formyltransferase